MGNGEIITLPDGKRLRVLDREIVRGWFSVSVEKNGKRTQEWREYAYSAVRCKDQPAL